MNATMSGKDTLPTSHVSPPTSSAMDVPQMRVLALVADEVYVCFFPSRLTARHGVKKKTVSTFMLRKRSSQCVTLKIIFLFSVSMGTYGQTVRVPHDG